MTASGGQQTVRRRRVADGVEHPMPSQIVVEVASGHTMETLHPAFPSAVVGVDVLHMERGTSHANALGQIDWLMRDAAMLGIALVD